MEPIAVADAPVPDAPRPWTPIAAAGRRAATVCERCALVCRDAHDLRKHLARKRPCQPLPVDLTGACPHCGEIGFGGGTARGTAEWEAALIDHCRRRCRGRSAAALAAEAEAAAVRAEMAELRAEMAELRAEVAGLRAEVTGLRTVITTV